ncbi:MAG: hypothetical protein GJ676_20145 [Rhodobacteraceae bacterium]|nr:hypothetical protein [Paracoccaceae bacterium]
MSHASPFELQMLALINEERSSRGVNPLQLELRLNDSSEDHSNWMLRRDVFSHTGQGGSSAGDRMEDAGFQFSGNWTWGENIAWQSERGAPGIQDDVINLHQSLMNSPGHRANILNPDFKVIGIGIETGDYNGWDAVMVTQNFARTSAPLKLDAGGTTDPDPQPDPTPSAQQPPVVSANTVAANTGKWVGLTGFVTVSDANGDQPDRYKLRVNSDDIQVRIDGELQPQRKIYTFDANDLNTVSLRSDVAGLKSLLALRARDDDGFGAWDTFNLITKPTGDAPVVAADNTRIGVASSGDLVALSDILTVLDGQNDTIEWVDIRDRDGGSNFRDVEGSTIDATRWVRVDYEDLDDIMIAGDATSGRSRLLVRASDGDAISTAEAFTLHSLPADDPLLLA